VKRFDWSPDGSQIVLAKIYQYELFVVDLGAQTETDLGTSGHRVRWSPDGNKIAFIQGFDLRTINPDGTDEQVIVAAVFRGKDKYVQEEIDWSPDSNHLVYTWQVWLKENPPVVDHFAYRVDVNSGDKTCMTKDLDDAWSHAWR
jgi:Tol biopolymer transport system component